MPGNITQPYLSPAFGLADSLTNITYNTTTSNGFFDQFHLKYQMVQCENERETVSFKPILPDLADERITYLKEVLVFFIEAIRRSNFTILADNWLNDKSIDDFKQLWFYLQKCCKFCTVVDHRSKLIVFIRIRT